MSLTPDELDNLRRQLVRDEAYRRFLYDDATGEPLRTGDTIRGVPTIGVGLNCMSDGLTLEESTLIAENRCRERDAQLSAHGWYRDLAGPRKLALVCMAFQLGYAGLMQFRKMIAAIERGDWPEAAKECLDSKFARQTPKRAETIANMLEKEVWP